MARANSDNFSIPSSTRSLKAFIHELHFASEMSEDTTEQPVTIVSENTEVVSGTAVQEKLILAARVFSDLLKPTFGPKGLDKMMYKTDGSNAVTNDGSKIISELLVKHPAAKMMVSMAESQEEACGDGVTTTMLICGSLLIEANTLMRKGINPLKIVDGFRLALDISKSQIVRDEKLPDNETLIQVAKTALVGKNSTSSSKIFSPIIVEALQIISKNREYALAEHISMYKSRKGGISDSKLIKGIVINRRILLDSLPNNISDCKIVCLDSDIKIRELTRNTEIKITSADNLDTFIEEQRNRKKQISDSIFESGINAIFCSGEIDKEILHSLADLGIICIGELDSSELRNLSQAVGAKIIETPLDIHDSDIGECGIFSWERREQSDKVEDIVRVENCKSPSIVTIEVGGGEDVVVEEIVRGIHDALRSTSLSMKSKVVSGAGSIHSSMAQAVRDEAEKFGGKERLAMEAYSRALESIPSTLVENSGGDPLDRILELRAATMKGTDTFGISPKGDVVKVDGVWHPSLVIENSIESATETAISMLRIDQVISSKNTQS